MPVGVQLVERSDNGIQTIEIQLTEIVSTTAMKMITVEHVSHSLISRSARPGRLGGRSPRDRP
jgi:hypothetical protein